MVPPLGTGPSALVADVGGTTIKLARVDRTGTFSEPIRVPTPRDGAHTPERILDAIARGGSDGADVIGIGIPGIVDDARGIGVFSENLGWRDVDFRAVATERFGSTVHVIHDVRAAALAELHLGAARGLNDAVILTIGTGISAVLITGGRMHVAGGYAGEIGHVVVDSGGEECACGNRGCLEATASAAAIARRFTRDTGVPVSGAHDVADRAARGDVDAARIWDSAVDAIALGISHAAALTAPEAVIIGGGLAEAGGALFDPLTARLDTRYRLRSIPVRPASFGENAGVIGVALHARAAAHH
ncbi:ROK family protein [Microbacterium suaedae]|uniref:ROK family protein n=1 Tax=Microbacterium suaedae TaxID=2067813 RepID=UPI001E4CDAB6|nr:ROK family protein [Microbacterium suaedae]